jgi:predicted nucleic acid-binding protein
MSRWYVDTSAAWKLLAVEAESEALVELVDRERPALVASMLLETELRRASQRHPSITAAEVTDLLRQVALHEMPAALFREAGRLPGAELRSLDALHLAAALRLDVDQVLTYDVRMAESARSLGLDVLSPGVPAAG